MTFYKDYLSVEQLRSMGFSDRQVKAILYVKGNGRIINKEYQELNNVSRVTATRDLKELVERTILKPSSITGAGSYYEI